MKKLRSALFGVAYLYLVLYIPIAFMAYCSSWYRFNCSFHTRCQLIGYSNTSKYINELTAFLRHSNDLPGHWSEKEKKHLSEVRDIFDFLTVSALIFEIILIFILIKYATNLKFSYFTAANQVIIVSMTAIIPFFYTFWADIFHPLLFDNDLWIITYTDRSYYIMPGIFFKNSFICLIMASTVLNGSVYFLRRALKKRKKE